LVLGGASAVVLALGVFIWSTRKEPPKAPVVEPPPPTVVAVPPPAKVEVELPAPPPEPVKVEPPPPAVPTVAQLKERVALLEKRVKELPAKSRPPAKTFLSKEAKKLAPNLNEEQRRELSHALDSWESKHLKK